jgi:hypothetical protein
MESSNTGTNLLSPQNPYVWAFRQAGFSVASGHVRIENFSIDYMVREKGIMSIREPLPHAVLFPWKVQAAPPKISILHFSLHECVPCHTEIAELQSLIQRGGVPSNVQLMQLVYGTDVTALIADEMVPLLPDGAKTYLDPEDGLADRLGAMGAPATFILDEDGVVVAYNNGSTDFDSPGMDVLMSRLGTWPSLKAKFPELTALHKAVVNPNLRIPDSAPTEWMKSVPIHFVLVVVVGLVTLPALFRLTRTSWPRLKTFLSKYTKK